MGLREAGTQTTDLKAKRLAKNLNEDIIDIPKYSH